MVHLISSVYASSKAAVNRSKRLSDEEIMVCCDRNDIDIAAAGHDGCGRTMYIVLLLPMDRKSLP